MQYDGIVAQLGEDESVEASSPGGVVRLVVDGLWHDSVALDEIGENVPLATIADGLLEQVLDHALEEPREGRRSKYQEWGELT